MGDAVSSYAGIKKMALSRRVDARTHYAVAEE